MITITKNSNPDSYLIGIHSRRAKSFKEAVEFVNNYSKTHVKLESEDIKGEQHIFNLTANVFGIFQIGVMVGVFEERKRVGNE